MKTSGIVVALLLFATPVQAEIANLTPKQAKCVLDHLNAKLSSHGVRDIIAACVDYRTANPKLFACMIRQQVKAENDAASRAVHDACIALSK